MGDTVETILAARRKQESETITEANTALDERFYSVLRGEGLFEEYFEIRLKDGTQTCLAYRDLSWFNYSKDENVIDLGFGMFLVQIRGRGLAPRFFDSIKARRVAWVKEADHDLQDSPSFECFIESIGITLPKPEQSDD